MSEQLVVVGDVHGQLPLVEAVRDRYQDVDRVIFAGDVVDGSNVNGVLETIKSIGATVVLGNHEHYLLGAMLEADEDHRRDMVDMWSRVHRGTLGSYGVYVNPTPGAALQLRDRMDQRGHLARLWRPRNSETLPGNIGVGIVIIPCRRSSARNSVRLLQPT
jgi:hypothetical protein